MPTLVRAVPIIDKGWRMLVSKSLHMSSNWRAKQNPKRAPSTTQKIRPLPNLVGINTANNSEDSFPPIVLLRSARKSGALDINPENALEILRNYQALARKPTADWEQRLCTEQNITPSTLALLARILNRCEGKAQKHLARQVMLSASALGENSATFELIESALRTESLKLPTFAAPFQRLGILAKKENDPRAMMLLGKVMLSHAREKEALEWFQKATQSSLDFEGAGEALVNEGRILLNRNDQTGARVAFQKAALDLDDPSGYFYLSQVEEAGSSQKEVYLLKAASSGIVEAWHNLGSLELSKVEQKGQNPSSVRDYGMAREWFQVAASDGFGLSILNMALICKAGGQPDDGLKWLERAEELPEVREQANTIRAQWVNDKIEVL